MSMKLICVLAVGLSVGAQANAQERSGWSLLAKADIAAIHDIVAENHPGPVNAADPAFARWLEEGRRQAEAQADGARSYGDYVRSLRLYVNGFSDGHMGVSPRLNPPSRWPGVAIAADGQTARITAVEPGVDAAVGAEVMSCDGRSIDQLMAERVDPYYWNRAIPHERWRHLPRLLLVSVGDTASELPACRIRTAEGAEKDLPLTWRTLDAARVGPVLAGGAVPAAIGLRKMDDVWLISLPTFQPSTEQVAQLNAIIESLTAEPPSAETRLVFDVRGNGGGNSAWGNRLARAVWGAPAVVHVTSAFDSTLDYRVSRSNIASVENNLARARQQNLTNSIPGLERTRDTLIEALNAGREVATFISSPRRDEAPAPEPTFKGRAYLVTDGACASACLDFADVMRRLPGVTHVGAATSADTIYMENTGAPLPSGLTSLSYSMKVYKNRERGGNEWYDPHVRWPSPPQDDEALVAWVRTLAS